MNFFSSRGAVVGIATHGNGWRVYPFKDQFSVRRISGKRKYMRLIYALVCLVVCAPVTFAQLTMDQKINDFQYVASVYDKNYGPYEWKRDTVKFDLLNIAPWLDKVRATQNDLDFYEVMQEYVSNLNDAHDGYSMPSSFVARLNFGVDIYDGKLLVDTITRSRLPAAEYPFVNGYELVSIDGVDANKMLDGLLRYEIAANPRSTRRLAAQLLTIRPQSIMPHAGNVPEIAVVIFRRPNGNLETYRIPWAKSGLLMTSVGKFPALASLNRSPVQGAEETDPVDPGPDAPPAYMAPLLRLQNCRLPEKAVTGFGSIVPVFVNAFPQNFTLRLGRGQTDEFYSGTFESGGRKLGFIRIPSYAPSNTTNALNQFLAEITFFQKNTDGLIVDEMRNPGGSVSYMNTILSMLMPAKWRSLGFEVRATSAWVAAISSSLQQAKNQGAPQSILDQLQVIKDELVNANRANRGRTNPVPLDDVTIDRDPLTDNKGNYIGYTKPLIVLIDEMSASGGDAFAATIQDNERGPLVGWRTMGAGGNVTGWEGGSYSQGFMTLTESLMNRKNPVITPDYPSAPYVENIGVRPDIQIDYMTSDNLRQGGKPFFDAAVAAMLAEIQKNQ